MQKKPLSLSMFDTVAACNKGVEFELDTPDGSPSGIFWTVLGRDSDAFREYDQDAKNERNRRAQMAFRSGKPLQMDSAQVEEQKQVDLLCVLSTGWRNMPDNVAFSVPACRDVLTKYPHIRRQVDAFIGDIGNFMKG